jgi:hypothetical protein
LPSTLDFTEPYNSIDSQIGSIKNLVDHTRPDLLASAGILGNHVRNPSNRHIKILTHVNRYIKSVLNLEMSFSGQAELDLSGYPVAVIQLLTDCMTVSQDLLITSMNARQLSQ